MSEYVLKINKTNKDILEFTKSDGFTFNPKNDIVKSFTVYDADALNKIILNKFTKEYKRVFALLASLSDESSDSDFFVVLGETQKLRQTLMYEYKKFLTKEAYEKFLNDLVRYEKFLNQSVLYHQINKESELKR